MTTNQREVDRLLAEDDSSSDEDEVGGLTNNRATIESLIGPSTQTTARSNRMSAPLSLSSKAILTKGTSATGAVN